MPDVVSHVFGRISCLREGVVQLTQNKNYEIKMAEQTKKVDFFSGIKRGKRRWI